MHDSEPSSLRNGFRKQAERRGDNAEGFET